MAYFTMGFIARPIILCMLYLVWYHAGITYKNWEYWVSILLIAVFSAIPSVRDA